VFLIDRAVQAGFPSPAEDHAQKRIDLNDVLIKHPQATFLLRVSGHSMREAGIDGDFTIKRLYKRAGRFKLQAANPTHPDIVPVDGQTVEIWGVVTNVIKAMPV
jgi:DNA polymerase V